MKKLLFLLLILVTTIENVEAQKNRPLFPQMPGMVSYTYRHSFARDVAATLDTIRSLGITDMEFSNLFGRTAAEIRQMLDERGMKCSSFGVSYNDMNTKIQEVGQNAKILGAKYVRVASIPHQAPFDLPQAQKAVEDFNRAGEILRKDFGITFCYHNHGFEFYPWEDGTFFDYIIQHTNPKYVGFEMDILWTFFPGHNPAELLLKYPKRFKLMHLKDLRKGIPGDMTGRTAVTNDVALGTGQLDLPAILKAARKTSIKHFYIEDESPDYAIQVPKSIAYLNSLTY